MLRPVLHIPRHPLRLARFGIVAALPATTVARAWRTPQARALFGGIAAHAFSPLGRPMSAAVGMALICAGHRFGWAVAAGGSQAITDALLAVLREHGARIETGVRVRSLSELPDADAVVLDLAPGGVIEVADGRLPAHVERAYRRYRHGPGAFKLDLAVEGGVPWTNEACRPRRHRPRRRHRSRRSSPPSATSIAAGCPSGPSCWSVSSTSPTRSAPPATSTRCGRTPTCRPASPATPSRPSSIRSSASPQACASASSARAVRSTTQIAAENENFVGGDIINGANTPWQVADPPPAGASTRTAPACPVCSSARRRRHPAPARTAMNGYNAAGSVLRWLSRRE